jgi:glyoxylase-like metal-dependent hydrolase (beta-lactamase superfamily II)
MHQIVRGIFYEDSYLGVTLGGLVFPFGVIMVDAPLRMEDARMWRSALLNQRGGNNRILVNLDAHPDRTLGARTMDCTIVAHQKTAQVYRNRPAIFKGQTALSGSDWELYSDAINMRWAPPDITFTQRMSLQWGGPEVILEHHPGPTVGSTWVILPSEKVVFVGDTVVMNQPPFLANADLDDWLVSLGLLADKYQDYTIVAGRGGLASQKAISLLAGQLNELRKNIVHLVKRNSSPEITEELISIFLANFESNEEHLDMYFQRLRYGLYQYYARNYRPSSSLEQTGIEEDEQ